MKYVKHDPDWTDRINFFLRSTVMILIVPVIYFCFITCGSPPTSTVETISLKGITLEAKRHVVTGVVNGRPVFSQEWHEISFKDNVNYRWTWGPRFMAPGSTIFLQTGWEEGTYDVGEYNPETKSFLLTFFTRKAQNPESLQDFAAFMTYHDPVLNLYGFYNMNWHVKGAVPKPILGE